MRRLLIPSIVPFLFVAVVSFAAGPTTKPTTQPSSESGAETPTLIKPDDKDALTANMDKDVVIEGVIEKAEWSSTGKVMRASFKDSGESKLQVIIFVKDREKFDKAFNEDVCRTLTSAKVRVKGKLK